MKRPTEFELYDSDNDKHFRVRFDYDPGEREWFDHRAGVGSPGYPASAALTEVNFGTQWEAVETYPQLDVDSIEAEIMQEMADFEESEQAQRAEAEYNAWNERMGRNE
jgi:hypothetical protein